MLDFLVLNWAVCPSSSVYRCAPVCTAIEGCSSTITEVPFLDWHDLDVPLWFEEWRGKGVCWQKETSPAL